MNAVAAKFRRAAMRLRVVTSAVMLMAFAAAAGPAVAAPPGVPLKTAFSTDFTDTWWNPAEPGWGIQMTQTGNFIFATVYAYGPDGKPMWFGGGVTATSGATFTGKLYVTSGPYFGGEFDAAAVQVREAGTMTFEALTVNSANFTYTFDGVTVAKAIQRQPLTMDDYSGTYLSTLTQTVTNCADPASNGKSTGVIVIQIAQAGTAMSVAISSGDTNTCSASGTYSQLGRSGRFDGTYNCTSGEVGNVVLVELSNHVHMFSTRSFFQSSNTACLSSGRIAGVVPD